MKKTFALSLVTCLALASAVRAEEEKKAEHKMEMAKPGPEHEKLGYFVGSWKVAGDMKPGAFGPGGKVTGTSDCKWFAGKFSVVCNDASTSPMGSSKGLGILSYDKNDKKYEYYAIESTDMMGKAERAEGEVQGDNWVYTSEDQIAGKTMKGRYTMSNMKKDSYDAKYEMSEDGNNWMTVMEIKYTKQGGGAKDASAAPAGDKKAAAKAEKKEGAADKK